MRESVRILSDKNITYEYYCVRIRVSKETGQPLVEEWFHDPKPKAGLKLHRIFHPAKTVYDPETGDIDYEENHHMGEWRFTAHHKRPNPEPGR